MTPVEYGPGRNPAMGPVAGVVGLTATERKRRGMRTAQVLVFIRRYIGQTGYPPSVREIAQGCKMSGSVAWYYLKKLEAQGAIRVTPRVARGIALVGGGKAIP